MKYYSIKRWTNSPDYRKTEDSDETSQSELNTSDSVDDEEDEVPRNPAKWQRFLLAPIHFLMKEYSISKRSASAIIASIFLVAASYILLSFL